MPLGLIFCYIIVNDIRNCESVLASKFYEDNANRVQKQAFLLISSGIPKSCMPKLKKRVSRIKSRIKKIYETILHSKS